MSAGSPAAPAVLSLQPALICFSHLRWDFVLQRPQHLMSRFAEKYRLFFWEEAIPTEHHLAYLEFHAFDGTTVQAIRPRVPAHWTAEEQARGLSGLLDQMTGLTGIVRAVLWFYTPMMWPIARHVEASAVVYDCMDELSAFRFAPPEMTTNESALMAAADVVFTGGHSIYEAKAGLHHDIHPFPSSVDRVHFGRARSALAEPADQAGLPHPRLGYYGVIDERLDLALIGSLARAHPDWSVVMVGPVAKIAAEDLLHAANLHWLGQRGYDQLPAYLAGWDVALMPFALNNATRFISPTKTPEYLAGGVQVVSTAIRDVVRCYGGLAAVHVADGPGDFVLRCEAALALRDQPALWRDEADRLLADESWDRTFERMDARLDQAIARRRASRTASHAVAAAAVHVADGPGDFVLRCEAALALRDQPALWRDEADRLLADESWDRTFERMDARLDQAIARRRASRTASHTVAAAAVLRGARKYDVTICGAGFAGSVLARQFAEVSGKRVLVTDRRDHVGGNAFDCRDDAGILIHRYGPHIFHTNSDEVFAWLSRFTEWRPYEHRVLAQVRDQLLPMPINRTTLNALFGLQMQTEAEVEAFLARRAEPVSEIRTSRDVVVNAIGTELYETFFQGYTRKQWGLDPSQLDKSVTARVPTRTNTDDRYFTDRHQSMPREGFTRMFERMLDHPGIELALGCDFHDLAPEDRGRLSVYTGPIDAYFGHRFGALPYRSLRFRHETLDQRQFQPVAVVNFPSEQVAYTRITEYKHLTGQQHARTSISYEYPTFEGDPYYPIPRAENHALFRRYEALAAYESDVIFAGRLGTYRYYNMDQVVAQALTLHRRLRQKTLAGAVAPTG